MAKQREQVTLFSTMMRIIWLGAVVVMALLGLLSAGIAFLPVSIEDSLFVSVLRSSAFLSLGIAAALFVLASVWVVMLLTGIPWVQPTWGWAPPSKRARSCARVRFNKQKALESSPYDVIIVGSGIGGLTTASCLARLGYKVCVLEAHEVAGGSTHEYVVDDNTHYKFPSGLHYVIPQCQQVLQASCGAAVPPVRFEKLGNDEGVYERIHLARCNEEEDLPIKNERQLRAELRSRFPGLLPQLENFERVATAVLSCFPLWSALHVLPWNVRQPLLRTVMPKVWWKYAGRTAEDVLNELMADAPPDQHENVLRLQAYLCGLWVDTGCPPHQVCFFMIAAVSLGFPHEGGAYPVGGPEEMAAVLVESLESCRGKCFVRAPVSRIVIEDGRAVGVQLSSEHCGGVILRANHAVIGACGWRNTARLVKNSGSDTDFPHLSDLPVQQGQGFVMANIGIKGTAQELGLECANLWPNPAGNGMSIFDGVRAYLKDPLGVPPMDIPMMITFPTLKDRGHAHTSKTGFQTAQLLVLANIDWFIGADDQGSETVDKRTPAWKHPARTAEYQELKKKWTKRLKEVFLTYYPQLEDKIEIFDVATPRSIEHYLPTGSGSAIGLDVSAGEGCRFTDLEVMKLLDMKTPVQGLWMTGQDTLLCGVPLAQAAGLLTALRVAGPWGATRFVLTSSWLLLASLGADMRKNDLVIGGTGKVKKP